MIKLMLNSRKPSNYAFFCPVSRVHLTVSSPVGFANEVTPAILKAVKAKTVLDVDGVIDLETGGLKNKPEATKVSEKAVASAKVEASAPKEAATTVPVESTESKGAEAPVDASVEKATTKKTKKAAKETE